MTQVLEAPQGYVYRMSSPTKVVLTPAPTPEALIADYITTAFTSSVETREANFISGTVLTQDGYRHMRVRKTFGRLTRGQYRKYGGYEDKDFVAVFGNWGDFQMAVERAEDTEVVNEIKSRLGDLLEIA